MKHIQEHPYEILENVKGYLQQQKVELSLINYLDPYDYYSSLEHAQEIVEEAQDKVEETETEK